MKLPAIYLTRSSDQERLIRALYEMGYTNNGEDDVSAGVADWQHNDENDVAAYPWIFVNTGGDIDGIRGHDLGPHHSQTYTPVNSIPHFLSHLKRCRVPNTETI